MLSRTVLIADDEVNLCRVLSARLRQSGLNCITVHNGVDALEVIRTQHVDAVVLDVRLPRINGVEALCEIRREHPQLPCILITAFEDFALHEQAVHLGANAVLQKPFDIEAFTELIWRELTAPALPIGAYMLLQDGEKVVVDIRRGEWSYTYTPRVISQDDRVLEVEAPLAVIDEEALLKGVAIVQFTRGDGLYQFRSRVVLTATPRNSLCLSKPVTIRRIQRRKHPRLQEKGQASLVFSLRREREVAPLTLTGELYDLSPGGFSVILPQAPTIGDEARFQITLSEANLTIVGQARVVGAGGVITERTPAAYRIGLEFTELSPAMRHTLREWAEKSLRHV